VIREYFSKIQLNFLNIKIREDLSLKTISTKAKERKTEKRIKI
jgi:hypothetical protein